MAVVDLRDKTKRYEDGSSEIALGMTAVQHQAATGDGSATGGWIVIAYMAGGSIGREVSPTKDYDESGEYLGETTDTDDYVIKNTVKQTDDITLKILKYWEDNDLPVRYPLPAGTIVTDPGPPEVTGPGVQMHYHPTMRKDKTNEEISTSRGQRQLAFTARGQKEDHVFATVDPADDTNWPASLANAKDDTFPGA